jgi:PAS domain-containing protein
MIIGFVGLIGSGKDTAADYLVNSYGFRRDSFAATLKDAVAAIFGWDREMLEGRTAASRAWREEVDPWWAKRLAMPDLTPRLILQQWGTEVGRRAFHEDIWIASLANKMRKTNDNIVITDCRFPNEIAAIRNAGGRVFRIKRGPDPDWWVEAEDYFAGLRQYPPAGVHASEWSWVASPLDGIIDNNGTIGELFEDIKTTAIDSFNTPIYNVILNKELSQ